MDKTVYVGVDPDIYKSGVAIIKDGEIETRSITFYDFVFNFISMLQAIKDKGREVIVYVEGSWLIKQTYKKHLIYNTSNVIKRIVYNVGMNHAVGLKLCEILDKKNIETKIVDPLRIEKKVNTIQVIDACISHNIYLKTRLKNQEERDAALLVVHYMQ
jgi:hypothetical protein